MVVFPHSYRIFDLLIPVYVLFYPISLICQIFASFLAAAAYEYYDPLAFH